MATRFASDNRIRDLLNRQVPVGLWEQRQLMVEVVHSFQGDERDVMFFSPCVGTPMPDGARHFLEKNSNLFNVAITRARASLQVVGNKTACRSCGIRFLEDFVSYTESRQSVAPIPPGPEVGKNEPPFREAMLQAGLQPMHQYKEHQYWLDFAIKEIRPAGREIKLDIEIDGWQHMGSRQDVLRDRRLMLLGWHVKRFWNYQVCYHLDACVAEVVRILDHLRNQE
jgi:very-short-patch-repair endonuclease